eukprot:gene3423-13468_t
MLEDITEVSLRRELPTEVASKIALEPAEERGEGEVIPTSDLAIAKAALSGDGTGANQAEEYSPADNVLPCICANYLTKVSVHRLRSGVQMSRASTSSSVTLSMRPQPASGKGNRIAEATGEVGSVDGRLPDIINLYKEHYIERDRDSNGILIQPTRTAQVAEKFPTMATPTRTAEVVAEEPTFLQQASNLLAITRTASRSRSTFQDSGADRSVQSGRSFQSVQSSLYSNLPTDKANTTVRSTAKTGFTDSRFLRGSATSDSFTGSGAGPDTSSLSRGVPGSGWSMTVALGGSGAPPGLKPIASSHSMSGSMQGSHRLGLGSPTPVPSRFATQRILMPKSSLEVPMQKTSSAEANYDAGGGDGVQAGSSAGDEGLQLEPGDSNV